MTYETLQKEFAGKFIKAEHFLETLEKEVTDAYRHGQDDAVDTFERVVKELVGEAVYSKEVGDILLEMLQKTREAIARIRLDEDNKSLSSRPA